MKIKFYLFLFVASTIISLMKSDDNNDNNVDNDDNNKSIENLENLINLVDARLDVVEKMTMYKYLEGLSVRSTTSEYNFIYNAYLIANTSDYIITNFFEAQLYASQIAQNAYMNIWTTYGGPSEMITYEQYSTVLAPALDKITRELIKTLKLVAPITFTKECPKLLKKAKANLLKERKIDSFMAPARAEALYVALGTVCNVPNNLKK